MLDMPWMFCSLYLQYSRDWIPDNSFRSHTVSQSLKLVNLQRLVWRIWPKLSLASGRSAGLDIKLSQAQSASLNFGALLQYAVCSSILWSEVNNIVTKRHRQLKYSFCTLSYLAHNRHLSSACHPFIGNSWTWLVILTEGCIILQYYRYSIYSIY